MIICVGKIAIIAQHFRMIVFSKYEYAALTLSSKELVNDGITKVLIGYALFWAWDRVVEKIVNTFKYIPTLDPDKLLTHTDRRLGS